MPSIFDIVIIFLVGFLTDGIWVLYITKVNEKKKLQAANYSAIIGLSSFLWLEGMLQSKILVVFWLFGLWLGTYFAYEIEAVIKKIFKLK